jgi:hypothetical protein
MGLDGAIYISKLDMSNCPKFLYDLAMLVDYPGKKF